MTYIIAEIGQNHNGDCRVAEELIYKAKNCGADAIKLTMRDINYEMTDKMAIEIYDSPNSYGNTYMEHRKKLELDKEEITKLCMLCDSIDIDVIITFCSHTLLDDQYIQDKIFPLIQCIKVASRDITNTLLIDRLRRMSFPLILSSGLSSYAEISTALHRVYKSRPTLMHCVSKYPTPPEEANLMRICSLKERFKSFEVGYSDHTKGIDAAIIAVAIGATFIEKHITLNKYDKGSDHRCSITPVEFQEMVLAIRNTERMCSGPVYTSNITDKSMQETRRKLMRSVCTDSTLPEGKIIKLSDLCLLSPGDGICASKIHQLVGRTAKNNIPAKTKISWGDLV